MSWLVSAKQYIPAVIGESFGGGYFAGYISHTADGNPTHALIVAPRETGATGPLYPVTTGLQWKTTMSLTTGTSSTFDGAANTAAMVTAGIAAHPAAGFCVNLSIGGFTDWYLPAQLESEIAYFNLKPSTSTNAGTVGTNVYAVPQRNSNWSTSYPTQTLVAAFNTSSQGFVSSSHWSSTQQSGNDGRVVDFTNGSQGNLNKTLTTHVRAFRRIAL